MPTRPPFRCIASPTARALPTRSDSAWNRFASFGLAVPATDQLPAEIDHHFQALYRWLDQAEAADGPARPEISDPSLQAAARLLDAALAAAHASDGSVHAWVSLEALRIWLERRRGS